MKTWIWMSLVLLIGLAFVGGFWVGKVNVEVVSWCLEV